MSPEGYLRYLGVTLAKMKERAASKNKPKGKKKGGAGT